MKENQGKADLYFNDIFGLNKSIEHNLNLEAFAKTQDLELHIFKNPIF
jgi:hypothetical protein